MSRAVQAASLLHAQAMTWAVLALHAQMVVLWMFLVALATLSARHRSDIDDLRSDVAELRAQACGVAP